MFKNNPFIEKMEDIDQAKLNAGKGDITIRTHPLVDDGKNELTPGYLASTANVTAPDFKGKIIFPPGKMQEFSTGATRSSDEGKPDYEGFLSPLVIEAFGRYMLNHQIQADGKKRESDNWQKGMPIPKYIKSMFRHLMDVWKIHRGFKAFEQPLPSQTFNTGRKIDMEEALCSLYFNVQGMIHEHLKEKYGI